MGGAQGQPEPSQPAAAGSRNGRASSGKKPRKLPSAKQRHGDSGGGARCSRADVRHERHVAPKQMRSA
uniref:Uncharacterized protein n=1 Tax=Oryza barthii TaxID=65489 RepID=A0A0D3F0Z9_9ORYZ